jgi:flagellar basal-body rod modification protein FlgD
MQISGAEQSQFNGMYADPVGSQDLGKEEFLQLLVTQLQNQDPMEPMSNTEFVAQLAQFSGVEQLVAVNEGLDMLGIQQMSMSNAQAASFIGSEVQIRSDQIQVKESDTEVHAAFQLSGDAASVSVNIRNAAGEIVRTMELGGRPEGETQLDWDLNDDNGVPVSPGSYRIDVVAKDEEGSSIQWEAKVNGVVDGITYDAGYPELVIGGDIKAQLSDVLGVYPTKEDDLL